MVLVVCCVDRLLLRCCSFALSAMLFTQMVGFIDLFV